MSTIITTGLKRRVEADQSGMTVTDTTDGRSIIVALTRAQARELAAALNPERDFSGVDWKAMYDQARSERDAAVYAYDKAERERDAAVARAEAAEASTAPALAEAVAWLYTPDGPPDGHDVNARAGTVWLDGIDHTPDEAVDLARALLAAAEKARDGVDR